MLASALVGRLRGKIIQSGSKKASRTSVVVSKCREVVPQQRAAIGAAAMPSVSKPWCFASYAGLPSSELEVEPRERMRSRFGDVAQHPAFHLPLTATGVSSADRRQPAPHIGTLR